MLTFCNYVDNRKICRKYVEYLLSLYKAKFPYNGNVLVFLEVHAWDLLLHSYMIVMSKYFNAKICIST